MFEGPSLAVFNGFPSRSVYACCIFIQFTVSIRMKHASQKEHNKTTSVPVGRNLNAVLTRGRYEGGWEKLAQFKD